MNLLDALLTASTPADVLRCLAAATWPPAHDGDPCPDNRIPTEADLGAWLPECSTEATAAAVEHANDAWQSLRTAAPDGHLVGGAVTLDVLGFRLPFALVSEATLHLGRHKVETDPELLTAALHLLWIDARQHGADGARLRHPLAPIIDDWQRHAEVTVEPDRRASGILPASMSTARRHHADHLPLTLDVHTPMGAGAGAQAHLPGLEPAASALVPVLPLALYDLAGGAMQTRGRGAPVAQRLFFEVLMSVGRLDRAPGQTARVESTYRELVTWLWPNLRGRRTWERSRHLPALYGALLKLDGMRIEWERQLWRLVGVTALPTAATRPDDPAVFRVEHLPGSERGPMIDREALRRFGTVSAPAWRAYLRLAYLWDRDKAKNGGRRIYATRPKVERARDGVLIGRDGRPVLRKDGRPVRDWSDARAVRLYGPNGEPLTERNPQADRVPALGPDDLVRLAYGDDLDTDRRKRLMRAREALDAMEAAGAVVIEPDGAGGGARLLEPPPAPE